MFIYTLYTLTGETLGQNAPLLERAMRTARAMPLPAGCPAW